MSAASEWQVGLLARQLGGGLPVSPWLLVAVGVVLAAAGMAMVWASGRSGRRRARAVHPLTGRSGALVCTAVAAGVITGAEWAVVSQTGPAALWVIVLGLPAFLAGATVARLLALARTVHIRRRNARAVLRERGNSR